MGHDRARRHLDGALPLTERRLLAVVHSGDRWTPQRGEHVRLGHVAHGAVRPGDVRQVDDEVDRSLRGLIRRHQQRVVDVVAVKVLLVVRLARVFGPGVRLVQTNVADPEQGLRQSDQRGMQRHQVEGGRGLVGQNVNVLELRRLEQAPGLSRLHLACGAHALALPGLPVERLEVVQHRLVLSLVEEVVEDEEALLSPLLDVRRRKPFARGWGSDHRVLPRS
jgi:hypothetical protein